MIIVARAVTKVIVHLVIVGVIERYRDRRYTSNLALEVDGTSIIALFLTAHIFRSYYLK
jgi:hypothetical protein